MCACQLILRVQVALLASLAGYVVDRWMNFVSWVTFVHPPSTVAAADRSLRLDGWCLILRILLLPPELIVYPHCVWRKKKSDEPEAVPI